MVNSNPLIHDDPSDTIAGIRVYLDYMCQSADDDAVHPGFYLSLLVLREAVAVLEQSRGDEKKIAQSV